MPWWAGVGLVSAVFIYATGSAWFSWLAPISPRVHSVLAHIRPWLDMGAENNLGVWWSGALLFLGSMLLLEDAVTSAPEARRPFAVLGVLSLGLSIDEVVSIHERLSDRWGWFPLILVGLVSAGLLVWALQALARQPGRRRAALLVMAGYALYGSVALQEAAEHGDLALWPWLSGRLEESTELLGSFLILWAAVLERAGPRDARVRAMIPRPDRLSRLASGLTAGLALHALVAVFVVPRLPDWEWRGNPVTWYPSAVHALAGCAAYWRAQSAPQRRAPWIVASGIFVLASIGAVFDEVGLFPGIDRLLPRQAYYGFYASYVFLVPALLSLGLGARLVRHPVLLVVTVALPLVLHWLTRSWQVDIVTPGVLACAFAMAFRVGEPPSPDPDTRPRAPTQGPQGTLLIIGPGVTQQATRLLVGSRLGRFLEEIAPRVAEVLYVGEAGRPEDSREGRKPRLHSIEAPNVRLFHGRPRRSDGRGRLRAVLGPGAWLPSLRLIQGAAFVHIWMPSFPGILAHLLCRLRQRPYSLYFVSDWEEIAPFSGRRAPLTGWRLRLYRWVSGAAERMAIRHARFTLVEGRGLQRKFASLHPRVVEAIPRLIMRAADQYERRDTCQGSVITLLHVGSVVPRKGVLLLVEALAILAKRGCPVRLQLVGGGDGVYQATVRGAVQAHGLEERVEFVGLVTDLPTLLTRYRQADIFVTASLGEGFPRVLIEATAQGLPIVASGIGSISAMMRHEQEALLVEPGASEALANGVARLMEDGALRRMLIRNGYAFAREHFARGRPSAQLLELIRETCPALVAARP